jgi:pimeloyl-ACP methyl ester carboxylesterase
VTLEAADGVGVYGHLYRPEISTRADGPLVLLFHQARADARGEYSAIIPRLQASGYTVLAVDQRSGGDLFGGPNRTAEEAGSDYGYCEAYADLEAALAWARGSGASGIAAWGSSYSAALVIRLAADYPDDVAAVLAFSPASGGPMAECAAGEVLDDLTTPALVFRPEREMDVPSVSRQAAAFEAAGIRVYVAAGGVHGSSMLDPSRAEGGVEATWEVVLDFLAAHLSPPGD